MKRLKSINLNENQSIENPQDGFNIVMNIQDQFPIRQCKSLLQCLRQPPTKDKEVINIINNQKLQKSDIIVSKKNKIYEEYKSVLKYTVRVNERQKFKNHKFNQYDHKIKQKNQTLGGAMNNIKISLLNQDNLLELEKCKVDNILSNNSKRQKIFQKALLFQRLYHIQKQKAYDDINKIVIPSRIKGYDPKHLRIQQKRHKTQQDYYRRKYVNNQRKFQFFKHAIKIQKQALETKQKKNNDVINTIMNAAKEEISLAKQQITLQNKTLPYLLFLKYSSIANQQNQQLFRYIKKTDLLKLLKDFEINTYDIAIMNSISKKEDFTFYEFVQLLHQIIDLTAPSLTIQQYLNELRKSFPQSFYPQLWLIKIKKQKTIKKYLKMIKFQQTIQTLFNQRMVEIHSKQNQLSLSQLIQLLYDLNIYPKYIDKKTLKFYFCYLKSESNRLSSKQLLNYFILIIIKRCDRKIKIEQMVKKMSEEINKFIKERH